jgi:hypothetical protein
MTNEDQFHMVKSTHRGLLAMLAALCCMVAAPGLAAERSSADKNPGAERGYAQRVAAEQYLYAVAAGDAKAVAQSIHEDELAQLRKRLVDDMKLEADRGESVVRTRLFGAGMPLLDIERMTPQNFFIALTARLRISGREFGQVDWLDAVGDSGGMVQMVGRLVPRTDRGTVRVPVLVSIVPWGKDWKAALPLELQAQIDDLRAGRVNSPRVAPAVAVAATPGAPPTTAPAANASASNSANPPEILDLFADAEKNLKAAQCDNYYKDRMSPNFRNSTGAKALRALITACENRAELREQLITALQLARAGTPRFQYAGTRAIYDLSGQGLPYPALIVEQVNKRWYIAE